MLFDRRPKTRREDFYDREGELKLFFKGIEAGEGLIVVYGVRRTGKTSLVYVGLSELNIPFVPIDARRFLVDASLLHPRNLLWVIEEILKQYERSQGRVKEFLSKVLEYVDSMDLGILSLRIRGRKERSPSEVLLYADKWARERKTRVVVLLDEAQELRIYPQWRTLLAWSMDNLENVTFVVTGSEVNVLNDFLKLNKPESPLFGRARLKIRLGTFSKEQSIDFLKKGFAEARVFAREEEIEDAINIFNGIVGWLTLYGYYRVTYGLSHDEALKHVEKEAVPLLVSELEKLVNYSPRRYVAVLHAISLGLKFWKEIKRFTEGIVGYVPDNRFNSILQNLVKYGFVERTENGKYRPIDPLLPKAVEVLCKKYGV